MTKSLSLNKRWDNQIEQDIENDKLEAFAQEAITMFEAGQWKEIWYACELKILVMLQHVTHRYSSNSRWILSS